MLWGAIAETVSIWQHPLLLPVQPTKVGGGAADGTSWLVVPSEAGRPSDRSWRPTD